MLKLVFSNEVGSEFKVSESWFSPVFKKIIKSYEKLKKADGELSLELLREKTMTKANKNYRKKNKSTDVISLSFLEAERFPGENIVARILICPKIATKQALDCKWSFKEEMQFLFIHGMLHLSGFDHENEKDREKMYKEHKKFGKVNLPKFVEKKEKKAKKTKKKQDVKKNVKVKKVVAKKVAKKNVKKVTVKSKKK